MKLSNNKFRRAYYSFGIISAVALLSLIFQNCSRVGFGEANSGLSSLSSNSLTQQSFTTIEDIPLIAEPKTFSSISRKKSLFAITKKPTHGSVSAFDSATGKFTYLPDTKFFGKDAFEYSEKEDGVADLHIVPVAITITMNDQSPEITTENIGFEMNKVDTQFSLQLTDYNDPDPKAYLSENISVTSVATANGTLKQISANHFSFTPKLNYRGTDQFEFFAINANGKQSRKIVYLKVENPFTNIEPSMAVRGMGCVTCHMKSSSSVITDFGAGDVAFFGKNGLAAGGDAFGAPWSFYNDHGGFSFLSATLTQILVPDVKLPFSLSGYAFSAAQKAATTIPEYVNAVKGSAVVNVKSQIFIGAPSAATLMTRTQLGTKSLDYSKNQDGSPELAGMISKGSYFESSNLTCDGDLTVKGPLFLNNLTLKTNSGCRIYATGPIFINGKISYTQAVASATNNTNLQLVSSVWINLGVGQSHCEGSPSYPAKSDINFTWYKDNNISSPFDKRIRDYSAWTRDKQQNPDTLAQIQSSIVGFSDASCRIPTAGELPRQVHFERLMLNAPRIDSRYTGQFDGIIIGEVTMMSLSAFSFTFDPVFRRVPILPLLLPSDYLVVK